MSSEKEPDPEKARGASIEPDIQTKLGEKLKEVYADVVNEPVPDRFTELLAQLAKSDTKNSDT